MKTKPKSYGESISVLARYKAESQINHSYIEQFGQLQGDYTDEAGEFTVIFHNPNDYWEFETMALSLGYIKVYALGLPS